MQIYLFLHLFTQPLADYLTTVTCWTLWNLLQMKRCRIYDKKAALINVEILKSQIWVVLITGELLIWFLIFRVSIMMALKRWDYLWTWPSTYTEHRISDCKLSSYSHSAKFWPLTMSCSLEIIVWILANIDHLLLRLLVTIK